MDYKQRLQLARDFGPRRPLLRHVLLCLVLWDTQADRLVYGGRLEHETGYSERAIRKALRELVELGWLEPEVSPRDGLDSVNQYGESARPRVHGHTGGCKAGGIGWKTRYFITYRTSPCEQKGARRSPMEGGTAFPPKPANEAGRGNAVPQKGEPGAAEGGTAFPRLDIERGREKDMAGGTPPPPPCEPDADRGAVEQQGMEAQGGARQSRQLLARWPDVVQRMATTNRDNITGIRLWIATPKVQPMELRGSILHVQVPSVTWAQNLEKYAAQLCAIVASLVSPCSTLVCHPMEAA